MRHALDLHTAPVSMVPLALCSTLIIGNEGRLGLAGYDVLGREVAVLVEELMPAGTYHVRWDATGCPMGVYVCRLWVQDVNPGPAGASRGVGGSMHSHRLLLTR